MIATFKVHQQGEEKYKNRKDVDVVSKRVTLQKTLKREARTSIWNRPWIERSSKAMR